MSIYFGMIVDRISCIMLDLICPNSPVNKVADSYLISKIFDIVFLLIKLELILYEFSFIINIV